MNKKIKKVLLGSILGVSMISSLAYAKTNTASLYSGSFQAIAKLTTVHNYTTNNVADARIDRTSKFDPEKGVWVRLWYNDMYNMGYDKGQRYASVHGEVWSCKTFNSYNYIVNWANTDIEYDKEIISQAP